MHADRIASRISGRQAGEVDSHVGIWVPMPSKQATSETGRLAGVQAGRQANHGIKNLLFYVLSHQCTAVSRFACTYKILVTKRVRVSALVYHRTVVQGASCTLMYLHTVIHRWENAESSWLTAR